MFVCTLLAERQTVLRASGRLEHREDAGRGF